MMVDMHTIDYTKTIEELSYLSMHKQIITFNSNIFLQIKKLLLLVNKFEKSWIKIKIQK
jgi:hypothetical protein